MLVFGWTKPFKACSDLPVLELLALQVNSTEAENQTGKSRHGSSFAKDFHVQFDSHVRFSILLFHAGLCDEEDCKNNQICEYSSTGTSNCTCASGFYGVKCEGTVHQHVAGGRAGRGADWVFLKRRRTIPQEFGAVPWKRLLWRWIIVIIKTDTASPSLLQDPAAWCCV